MPTTRELEGKLREYADILENQFDELQFVSLEMDEEFQGDIGGEWPPNLKMLSRTVIEVRDVVGGIANELSDVSRELGREAFCQAYPQAPGLRRLVKRSAESGVTRMSSKRNEGPAGKRGQTGALYQEPSLKKEP
jgi:hypothetical protein